MKQDDSGNKRLLFHQFVREHRKKIYYLAYDLTGSSADAEDLSQEVFLKAYKALDSFREDASMYTWLYRITVTTFIDQKRKKSSQAQTLTDELDEKRLGHSPGHDEAEGQLTGPERLLHREQMARRIEGALQKLSERERSVFMLKHQSDMRIDEIATMLDIAPGTVKSFLFRATQKLRGFLTEHKRIPQGGTGES